MKNLTLLFTIMVLASCGPKYYVPHTVNAPLIAEKKELNLAASGRISEWMDAQGSYGLTDHLAIMGGAGVFNAEKSQRQEAHEFTGTPWYTIDGRVDINSAELGLGYYNTFGNHMVSEIYGLAGIGNVRNKFKSAGTPPGLTRGSLSTNFSKLGLQYNVGIKRRYMEVALSLKAFHLQYFNIKGDLFFEGADQFQYLNAHDKHFVFEPAFTVRAGFKNLKLQGQICRSYNLTHEDFNPDEGFLSLGIYLNFNAPKERY